MMIMMFRPIVMRVVVMMGFLMKRGRWPMRKHRLRRGRRHGGVVMVLEQASLSVLESRRLENGS